METVFILENQNITVSRVEFVQFTISSSHEPAPYSDYWDFLKKLWAFMDKNGINHTNACIGPSSTVFYISPQHANMIERLIADEG